GMLKDISLAQMVRHVKETIVSGWEAERGQRTAVLDLSATFALEDGIASNGDLKLQTRDLTVTGDGRVDLLRRAIDYKVAPTISGETQSSDPDGISVPIIVRGPWAGPKIYPDIAGILENPRAGFETLKKLRNPTSRL